VDVVLIPIEQPQRKRPRRKIKLPHADGEWIDDHIFLTRSEVLCVDSQYLYDRYPWSRWKHSHSRSSVWYRWLRRKNPHLGRTLRAFLVKLPPSRRQNLRDKVIVWVHKDVKDVNALHTDQKNRQCPPGPKGSWITDEIWDDNEYGPCGTDDFLRDHVEHEGESFFSSCRRRDKHPALDPKVNRGRVRFRRGVLHPKKPLRLIVTCIADARACATWQKNRKHEPECDVDWGMSCTEIARALRITDANGRVCLDLLLKAFRREHPEGARQINQKRAVSLPQGVATFSPYRYDFQAFKRSLGGKSVKEAAAERAAAAGYNLNDFKSPKKIERAVRFLMFMLTHGSYSPNLFALFLREPPSVELAPFGPVDLHAIVKAAKRERIGATKNLKWAKKILEAGHGKKGHRDKCRPFWFLTKPVNPSLPINLERVMGAANGDTGLTDPEVRKAATADPLSLSDAGLGSNPAKPFIPTAFQERLLKLLKYNSLTADKLEGKLCIDRKNLYKRGINPLKERGLIVPNRRFGYFRPDFPPPKIAEFIGKNTTSETEETTVETEESTA
jgi:hypothetical protein